MCVHTQKDLDFVPCRPPVRDPIITLPPMTLATLAPVGGLTDMRS